MGDAPPVEIVDRRQVSGRGEPAVVEQPQRRRPILPAVGAQQRRVTVGELVLRDALGRQRIDMAGLATCP